MPRLLLYFLAALILHTPAAIGQVRSIKGTYRNFAQGFAVRIPSGLVGVTGDQDGPERGFHVTLNSGTRIRVYGEPNSALWDSPDEGVRNRLSRYCPSKPTIAPARVGRLKGSAGRVTCGHRSFEMLLAFRPHGGPVYWLEMETEISTATVDRQVLQELASSFKLIAWK